MPRPVSQRRRPRRKFRRSSFSGSGVLQADFADAARATVLRGRAAGRELRHESRKLDEVLARLARRVAAEAREAVGDVGRVADLVRFAVADDVDAGRDLPPHDVGDGVGNDRSRRALVLDLASSPGENSTSVTACERGRLPTCVVRMRSVLPLIDTCCSTCDRRRASASTPMGVGPSRLVDLLDIRMIERELDDQAVRVGGIDRPAIAVIQHE